MTVYLKDNHLRQVSIAGKENNIIAVTPEGEQLKDLPHDILELTMKDGEEYAIDIAGAQYGYHYPVYHWETFGHHRIRYISQVYDFGHTKGQLSKPGSNPLAAMMKQPARAAIMGNQRLAIENLDAAFDEWFAQKQVSIEKMLKMGKKKHDALMSDMVKTLGTSMNCFVDQASKSKDFVVAIRTIPKSKDYPKGRTMYVKGDGSTSYLDEMKDETDWPKELSWEEEMKFLKAEFPKLYAEMYGK